MEEINSATKILEILISINPISAISIIFSGIVVWHSKVQSENLKEMHSQSIKEIRNAYSDSMKQLREFINNKK